MFSSPMFDVAGWVIKMEALGNQTPIGRVVRSHTIFGLLAALIGCVKAGAAPPVSKVGRGRADHFYQPWACRAPILHGSSATGQ